MDFNYFNGSYFDKQFLKKLIVLRKNKAKQINRAAFELISYDLIKKIAEKSYFISSLEDIKKIDLENELSNELQISIFNLLNDQKNDICSHNEIYQTFRVKPPPSGGGYKRNYCIL